MVKGIEGAKLGRVRVGSYVGFCHRGRRKNFNIAAIDSREEFLSRAKERNIEIPDDADAFYFFDILYAEIHLPNRPVVPLAERTDVSNLYYYEGQIAGRGWVETRFGDIEPLTKKGDKII